MDAKQMMQMCRRNNNYAPSQERYDEMEYRRAGRSGLKLSALSFGLWNNFGSTDSVENMRDMIFTAFDNGITVFDIANNYGPVSGAAERNFGGILARDLHGYRDELIITTKAGFGAWRGPYGGGNGGRKHLIASLDRSLVNLGVEYVDIFYHHRPDPDTPMEETALALKHIVDSGKALYVGISNYTLEQTKQMCALLRENKVPFVLNQVRYSLLDRTAETSGLKAFARENGFALTAYSPLAQGLLTDKYLHGIPQDSRMNLNMNLKKESLTDEVLQKVAALNEVAAARGQSLAEMAVSWLLRDEDVASVIIGASRSAQILEDLRVDKNFTAEQLKKIDEITL